MNGLYQTQPEGAGPGGGQAMELQGEQEEEQTLAERVKLQIRMKSLIDIQWRVITNWQSLPTEGAGGGGQASAGARCALRVALNNSGGHSANNVAAFIVRLGRGPPPPPFSSQGLSAGSSHSAHCLLFHFYLDL